MELTDKLKQVVGVDNYSDDPDILEAFAADMSFAPRMAPGCVVTPRNSDEVQNLIRLAGQSKIPLIAVSSGKPRFRGDTVPGVRDAVIVDLSAMKDIIRIDRKNRVAMIETGVTFDELIPALSDEGLRLNMPLLPKKAKSVIGSMLEREPVTMPVFQWDSLDPLLCTEVYFGTGDRFRTGSAAGPGSLEEQWNAGQAQLNPMGPGQADIVRVVQGSQGTMGIVTWASVRCEVLPSLQKAFFVGCDEISQVSEFIYKLLWLRSAEHCILFNNSTVASIMGKDKEEREALKKSLPPWLFFYSLAGYREIPEERIAYQEEQIFEAAGKIGLKPEEKLADFKADKLFEVLSRPSDDPYWKIRDRGGCKDIFFLTTLDKTRGFVEIMTDIALKYGYDKNDLSVYIQPMVQGTCCHCEFNMFYDPSSDKETENIKKISTVAAEKLQSAGAFFSRPYGAWADMVYGKEGETVNTLKKAKQIFDPYNIMNPGKLCFQESRGGI